MFSFVVWASTLALVCFLQPLAVYIWDAKQLRRFPCQNSLSGITNFGYIIERCRGFRSRNLHKLHQKKPIVRLGPTSLSFSSPEAIRAIYGHSTKCIKGDMYAAPAGLHSSLLDVIDNHEHARKRRYMSHALATRNLKTWEDKIVDKVERLVRKFDRICLETMAAGNSTARVLDFRKWSNLFTIEAISDIALSARLGCLERGDDSVGILSPEGNEETVRYVACLHAGKRVTSMLVWSTGWFRPLRAALSILPGYFRSQWAQGRQFDNLVQHLTLERIRRQKDGEKLDDIVRCILEDKNGEARGLDVGEVEAEVSVLLDAGSDTTAIALTHVMYDLVRHPKALEKLRVEVDAALDPDTLVARYDHVDAMPYLLACLDESMRLLPPVSFGLNRKTAPEGTMIDGQWIPGGTTVAVPAYTAHRNPDAFPDPESYRPERWLGPDVKVARSSFIPFSAGARGCIGRNITYMEQTMLVATLIHRYDFTLADPSWKLEHEEAFNLWPSALPLRIRKRDWDGQ